MVRKILLTFLISLAIMPISNASVQLTVDQADQILDYFAENCEVYINGTSDTDINTTKSKFRNVNRETFTNTFNSNFVTKIGITDEYDWSNITILGGSYDSSHYAMLYFFVSNCSASDTLNYLKINRSSSGYSIGYWIPETEENASKLNLFRMQIRDSSTISTSATTTYPSITYIASNDVTDDGINVTVPSFLGCAPAQVVYYNNGTEVVSRFLNNYIKLTPDIDIPDEPESGDTSGDIGGGGGSTTTPDYSQDLDDIKNEIGETNNKLDNIQNSISGETNKVIGTLTDVPDISGTSIGSGDIEDALNFDFAEDPYSNFWYELTTGLGDALTGNNRSIKIDFRNKSYNINLDDFSLQLPQFLKSFLTIISTVFVVWQMIRYVKIIIDKISSGNMDEVLAMNEEERNC